MPEKSDIDGRRGFSGEIWSNSGGKPAFLSVIGDRQNKTLEKKKKRLEEESPIQSVVERWMQEIEIEIEIEIKIGIDDQMGRT